MQIIPDAIREEVAGGMAALEIVGVLRAQRRALRELIHLAMERGGFLLEPEILLGRGKLVAQEIQHFARVLDLPLLIVELLHRLVAAPLRSQDLQLHLLDLDRQHQGLVEPVIGAALPARLGQVDGRGFGLHIRDRHHHLRDRLEHAGELGADRDLGVARAESDEDVGDHLHGLPEGLSDVRAGAHLHRVGREADVLHLIVEQAVLIEAVVIDQVGLADILGLLQRLNLPVGVAPLVLPDGQAEREQFALLSGAQRREIFRVALLVGASSAAPNSRTRPASSVAF